MTTWFTVSYEEETSTVAGLKLPAGASLRDYGQAGSSWYFPEDLNTFWVDTSDAAEIFNPLVGMSRFGHHIDLPGIYLSNPKPRVSWGDIVYCLVTRKVYIEEDGAHVRSLHLLKLIVG